MAKKAKEGPQYESWEEVDNALRRLCEIEVRLAEINGRLNTEIDSAKTAAEKAAATLLLEKKILESAALAFAESRKEDFQKTRSKRLNFGTIAFRVVTRIKEKNAEATIRALRALGLESCVKVKETLDKEELAKLDDKDLVRVGVSRKIEDKPRIELDVEKVKEAQ